MRVVFYLILLFSFTGLSVEEERERDEPRPYFLNALPFRESVTPEKTSPSCWDRLSQMGKLARKLEKKLPTSSVGGLLITVPIVAVIGGASATSYLSDASFERGQKLMADPIPANGFTDSEARDIAHAMAIDLSNYWDPQDWDKNNIYWNLVKQNLLSGGEVAKTYPHRDKLLDPETHLIQKRGDAADARSIKFLKHMAKPGAVLAEDDAFAGALKRQMAIWKSNAKKTNPKDVYVDNHGRAVTDIKSQRLLPEYFLRPISKIKTEQEWNEEFSNAASNMVTRAVLDYSYSLQNGLVTLDRQTKGALLRIAQKEGLPIKHAAEFLNWDHEYLAAHPKDFPKFQRVVEAALRLKHAEVQTTFEETGRLPTWGNRRGVSFPILTLSDIGELVKEGPNSQ